MTTGTTDTFAIFVPSLLGGGAERVMLTMAHGLAERGYAVDLVLAQAKGPYLSQVQESIRVIDLEAPRVLSSLPALVRYLRRERPKALLTALDYANVVAIWAKRLAGVASRIIVTEHNTMSQSSRNSPSWRQRMMPLLVRTFYPWADGIISPSKGVAQDLCRLTGLPPTRVHVIYNPVITPELQDRALATLGHKWFGADQPPVILAVGRLTQQKDFPTLIRAFARLRSTTPARLIILGEGPDRGSLEALVTGLGMGPYVALPGFVDNPYGYMRQCALFVLSSRWEGLPTVLIEALYCGAPIVSTDCPSGPREILHDGQYGALVPVGDVEALASAISAGLAGAIPRPTRESWQPYTLNLVVDQYVDLLVNGHA